MRRPWLRLPLVLAVSGSMILAAACGGSSTPTTTKTSTSSTTTKTTTTAKPSGPLTVTVFQTTKPSGDFNPLVSESEYETDIAGEVFDDLLTVNKNLGYIPWMATYNVSNQGKTITFKLKPGIKFQDGNPLTSADVQATFDFIFNPDYPGPLQSNYTALAGAQTYLNALTALQKKATPATKGGKAQITQQQYETQAQKLYKTWESGNAIQTPDSSTVVFNLDQVYAPILNYLGLIGIYEKSQLDTLKTPDEVKNAAKAAISQHPIGTGPFSFVKYQTGQYTELKANPNYWAGAPKFQQLIFRVANQSEEVGLMQKGKVDILGAGASQIDPKDTSLIQKIPGVRGWEYPQFGLQVMDLNLRQPRFQDYRVRQAMMYAINRKGVIDSLMDGHATAVNTFFAPPSWASPASVKGMYPYDPTKAAKLLKDAGWTKNSSGVLTKGNMNMAFTLLYPNNSNPVRQKTADVIQQDLNAVGFKVTLDGVGFNTEVQKSDNNSKTTEKSFDALLIGWGLSYDPDTTGLFSTKDEYNLSYWNPKAAPSGIYAQTMTLTRQGVATFDQATRTKIYQQLATDYATYLPNLFLYSQNQQVFVDARIASGVTEDARGALFQTENWTVKAK